MNVVRGMPPLVLSEEDVESFAAALDAAIAGAQKIPRAMVGFAIRASRA